MKQYVGYIRVSTVKQGQHSVSLPEQKDAISRYAERNGCQIFQWFEEQQTAAKRGRPIFSKMIKLLKSGKAQGVVIHKIDRSARNLRDWADLVDLADQGIEVQIATDNIDLRSRGGRLSADIQAVVAADFIRNLREETRKGFYGRLKQGFYPLRAPVGYLDRGRAQAKAIDPVRGPLVRKAFELYATGGYSLHSLLAEMTKLGFRNHAGKPLTVNGVSTFLNNPFYMGHIRIRRTGETFEGNHPPIISKSLFDRTQRALRGKTNTRTVGHNFALRRMFTCAGCGYSLIGETQKGHVYYRCHTTTCVRTTLREETIETKIHERLSGLTFSPAECSYLMSQTASLAAEWQTTRGIQRNDCALQLGQHSERLGRLTDAFVDQLIDRELFEERKARLLSERAKIRERIASLEKDDDRIENRLQEFLELVRTVNTLYAMSFPEEKRELLNIVTSNRTARAREVAVELSNPFRAISERFQTAECDQHRDIPRTWNALLPQLVDWVAHCPDDISEKIHGLLQGRRDLDTTETEKPRQIRRNSYSTSFSQ